MKFTFKEISPKFWPDFERLFGDNGACGGCWCQWWRLPKGGKIWEEYKGAKNKRRMKKLITAGNLNGLLAFDGNRAVAWCSFGPRSDFPRLDNTKSYKRDDTDGVWSINCFFIDRNYRGKNLTRLMLGEVCKILKRKKVEIAEGYPTPLTLKGEKQAAAFSFTGPLKIFEEAGFEIVQRISHSRPLVRKKL